MMGSLARRERRPLWGIFTFLLMGAIGFSLWAAANARNEATGEASADAELAAQTELQPLLQARDLTTPITGDRAQELSAEIERSITSVSAIDGVRIFSSLGRILYAEDPKFVGTRPTYLRNLTFEVASGASTSLVRDGLLQTYVPVWANPGGAVAVAELSQPLGPITTAATAEWYRLATFAGVLFLLSLGMVAVTTRAQIAKSSSPAQVFTAPTGRLPHDLSALATEAPIYQQPGFRAIEQQRQDAERRANAVEENFRAVQKRLKDALDQVKELEGRLAMTESHTNTTDGDLHSLRDQLRETSERLHKADLDNNALRERMALRNQELDEARRLLTEARATGESGDLLTRLEAADERAADMERQIDRLENELEYASQRFHMSKFTEALREYDNDAVQIEQEDDLFEHPVIIRNASDPSHHQRVR